ncbi:MAG: polyphosphate kinase 1 [Chitinophagales bacterium]
MAKRHYVNREISWLSFNERVLQEAKDPSNPLLERVKFLGIFSNNLDEFFRVRFATIKRIVDSKFKIKSVLGGTPEMILKQIKQIAFEQRDKFENVYNQLLEELEKENIHLINEKELDEKQSEFVRSYFQEKVRPTLTPLMIDSVSEFPNLDERRVYLAVKLFPKKSKKVRYFLIVVPTHMIDRFLILPQQGKDRYIIQLDDIIRHNLDDIFYIFNYSKIEAYVIKVTKDAELNIDNDVAQSFLEQLRKSLKKRAKANPVRFVYDENMPDDLYQFLISKLNLSQSDNIQPGGRYHNHREFMHFPDLGRKTIVYRSQPPLLHPVLRENKSVFAAMKKRDFMLHFPYHSFHHFIDFLREAAIDPKVTSIKMTLYRVADQSAVINALMNAIRNGKRVTVVVEIQARFDEEHNIYWAKRLHREGANIIYGVKGYKVHSKLCIIGRKEKGEIVEYLNIGTGNYNEATATLYTDESLFTTDTRLTNEVNKLFNLIENPLSRVSFDYLMVSPFDTRTMIIGKIRREIENVKAGKTSGIMLKINGLADQSIIDELYIASQAGVKVRLICRSICCLKPGIKGLSENIEVISIVDKYLEHSRIYYFENDGDEELYISSADLMIRNLDYRIEVACPIFEDKLKHEIIDILNIQFSDNVRARIIDSKLSNRYISSDGQKKIRAQEEIYTYIKDKYSSPKDQ